MTIEFWSWLASGVVVLGCAILAWRISNGRRRLIIFAIYASLFGLNLAGVELIASGLDQLLGSWLTVSPTNLARLRLGFAAIWMVAILFGLQRVHKYS
ncbi:hypothetical protein [Herpetosiphon geysericola]|uniref:Uncharacterized protein n=1 Tax=Herpetosiphon geysericola TaxID=70996 RepID=A0A0P6XDT0_9CHLR|nr:hypothetical protein [Herpetosiphon geysericola]KPL81179.1 hypothetical protein SE18_21005 [Herpetosiphon geysericola]